jgi:hypothetical protein
LNKDQNFYWNYGLCKHQDQQWLKICQVDDVNLKLIRHKINTKEHQLIYKKSEVYNSWYIANMAPSYISQEISQNKTYIWQGVITWRPLSFKLQTIEMAYNHQIKCVVHSTHYTLYFAEKKKKKKKKGRKNLTYHCLLNV